MEITISELETICMELISYTGEGRGLVHEAIEAFAAGDLDTCQQKAAKADEMLVQAHNIQFTRLLKPQAQGAVIPYHLLLLHAMDLLMVSTSELDVLKKMISGSLSRKAVE